MRILVVAALLFSSPASAGDTGSALSAQAAEILKDAFARQVAGDPLGAAGTGEKAAWLAPNDPAIRTSSAYLRFMAGQPKVALEESRLALALVKRPKAELMLVMAMAFYGLGDAKRGLAALKRAARDDKRLERLILLAVKGPQPDFSLAIMEESTARINPAYSNVLAQRFGRKAK